MSNSSASSPVVGGDGAPPSLPASAIVGKAVTGSHVLKIDGYSRTTGIGTGKCVKSRPFTVGGHQWCLEYYPDGYDSSSYGSNRISIRLRLAEAGAEATALYKISLLDQDGRPGDVRAESPTCCSFYNRPPKTAWKKDRPKTATSLAGTGAASAHGSYRFIKSEDLLRSAYLKDDAFSVRCDVTVVTEIVAEDAVVGAPAVAGFRVKEEAHGV